MYALLCDFFRFGLAKELNALRGPKWVKELDYFFIIFSAIGAFISVMVFRTAPEIEPCTKFGVL